MEGSLKSSDFAHCVRKSRDPQKPLPPLQPPPPLGFESRVLEDGKTQFEKDHAIPMRDGIKLYANLFRPVDSIAASTPTIVLFSPFGKHGAVPRALFQNMGVDFDRLSKYTNFELPDPLRWCPEYGYSLLIVDARATWYSEGETAYWFSPEEGRDGYDIVEWAAQQPWCTGKVGWGAVSYFAMSCYQVAALKPPHLAAIMPWEGMSDVYREVNCLGGIPSSAFGYFWMTLTGHGLYSCEDNATTTLEYPMFTPFQATKVVDWGKIETPAFSVTGWSSLQLHLRGTIAAWKAFSSKHKYLYVHGGREWGAYYSDNGQRRQKAFWDRFLKDKPTEVDSWPPVEIEVRSTFDQSQPRAEETWPPKNVSLTPLLINGKSLELGSSATSTGHDFVSFVSHQNTSSVSFDYKFAARTEITGNMCAILNIQAMGFPDADLYVAVQKINQRGEEVKFYNQTQLVEASAAHGWLRVSHREKDDTLSRPDRPVHAHQRRLWVTQSDIVPVEIEIWPSSTVWEEGEILRLTVQGHTFFQDTSPVMSRHANCHNFGDVRVWFGGEYKSQLLVPIVTSSGHCLNT